MQLYIYCSSVIQLSYNSYMTQSTNTIESHDNSNLQALETIFPVLKQLLMQLFQFTLSSCALLRVCCTVHSKFHQTKSQEQNHSMMMIWTMVRQSSVSSVKQTSYCFQSCTQANVLHIPQVSQAKMYTKICFSQDVCQCHLSVFSSLQTPCGIPKVEFLTLLGIILTRKSEKLNLRTVQSPHCRIGYHICSLIAPYLIDY